MEPQRQVEIQLGHMCNDRCVFCVSGQRTAQREALPLDATPLLDAVRNAHAQGIRKITLLGGEPTLQPAFMDVVREAARLGFDEIVVFTNGAKTARASFVDEVLASGGKISWRLSFQGATASAHEQTTKKLGSFQRLVQSLENLRERGQKVTVNLCMVTSNYASVPAFPALLMPRGVQQLHVDMMRPLDAGQRTDEEMRAMLPRYSDLAAPLRAMVAGFPDGFDVNIGNLPYCIAPDLAPWIHHDGETTFTVAVDEGNELSAPWDKYQVKRRDKHKPARCASCVFDAECSGVFDTYQRFYGTDELVPVDLATLRRADPKHRLFAIEMRALVKRLEGWTPAAPFAEPAVAVDEIRRSVSLRFDAPTPVTLVLRPPRGGIAGTNRFSLHVTRNDAQHDDLCALAGAVFERLLAPGDLTVTHPIGDDLRAWTSTAHVDPRLNASISRLRAQAPFDAMAWERLEIDADGRCATARFRHRDGGAVSFVLSTKPAGLRGTYRLEHGTERSPALADGVRGVMEAMKPPR